MKKIFLLLSLVVFLTPGLHSCGKKESDKKSIASQTLEERYPGWANLTWIATDENPRAFPRMEITIRKNVVTIREFTSDADSLSKEFTVMYLLGNTLTLEDKNKGRLTAFFWQTDSTFTIKTQGLVDEYQDGPHTFMLKKN